MFSIFTYHNSFNKSYYNFLSANFSILAVFLYMKKPPYKR
nr:MAG TPA: hypothetical protein [Caudoviricetes sp.]